MPNFEGHVCHNIIIFGEVPYECAARSAGAGATWELETGSTHDDFADCSSSHTERPSYARQIMRVFIEVSNSSVMSVIRITPDPFQ